MARGRTEGARRYTLPEDHDLEGVQRRAAKEHEIAAARKASKAGRVAAKPCRVCGILLSSGTEYRIGVHVWCVYNSTKRLQITSVPRPRYGIHK